MGARRGETDMCEFLPVQLQPNKKPVGRECPYLLSSAVSMQTLTQVSSSSTKYAPAWTSQTWRDTHPERGSGGAGFIWVTFTRPAQIRTWCFGRDHDSKNPQNCFSFLVFSRFSRQCSICALGIYSPGEGLLGMGFHLTQLLKWNRPTAYTIKTMLCSKVCCFPHKINRASYFECLRETDTQTGFN